MSPTPTKSADDTPAPAVDSAAAESAAPAAVVEAPTPPAPNAIVSAAQLTAAIQAKRWTHDEPGTALWLNTSFPPAGKTVEALRAELVAHGVEVR